MRAVVQRVKSAQVHVDGELVGSTRPGAPGIMVLVGAGRGDTDADARALADKVVQLRIFEDENERMNLSLVDVGGSLLVVSQFTLFGDCRKGRRPSFVSALEPEEAERLVEVFVARAREAIPHVETGRFRTHMEVSLINDGPVTLLIDTTKAF